MPHSRSFVLLLTLAPAAALADPQAPFCSGDYADDLTALSSQAREFDRRPQSAFSYCVRNVATYECLSYGADGNIRRVRRRAVLHGTAFAYRQQGSETLLLTNDHVATWPAVTDDDHPVEGVPAGCKKISETLKIVDNDDDAYDRDDIPLSRLVDDPQLDVAVLAAKAPLTILPWKIGHSAALRERNVVEVRGFPLGAFRATNVGKVVSPYDHDDWKDWDHDDFVIDALLSQGNSGSPVLAVSCKTGEYELVGIYHAAYSRGSALNVVVAIDQIRDLMNTLKRTPRTHDDATPPDAGRRGALSRAGELFFPFGSFTAAVRTRADGALLFELFAREFPVRSHPLAVIEDVPAAGAFGELGRVWFGGSAGLRAYTKADLDADAQAQIARALDALRHDALTALDYQTATRQASSRERFERMARLESTLQRTALARRDTAQGIADLADRLGARDAGTGLSMSEVLAVTPPAAPAPPPQTPPATPPARPPAAAPAKATPAKLTAP